MSSAEENRGKEVEAGSLDSILMWSHLPDGIEEEQKHRCSLSFRGGGYMAMS